VGCVLIGGELNGQFKQGALCETGHMKSKLFTDFLIRNNMLSLQSVYGRHNEYTFKTTQVVLDYFLVDGQCLNYVSMFDIEQPEIILTSDHIHIMCSLYQFIKETQLHGINAHQITLNNINTQL